MTYYFIALRFVFIRFRPGAFGLPLRGDAFSAFFTNSSSRAFGTARTPRMTSLKCWNSSVESKASSFITLPKRSYVSRAPVSSMYSWALASLAFRLASQLSIRQSASHDLLHDADKTFRVRRLAVVVAVGLLIEIAEEMKGLDADVGAVQSALRANSRSSPSYSYERFRSRTQRHD